MRISIVSILLFFSFWTGAQTNTFYRKYNLSGMQGALGLVNLPDGGFVGTGQHEDNGSAGGCDIYVYRVDACGTLLWMKLIGTAAKEGGKSINIKKNGELLVVGLYDLKGMIIDLDLNGNVLWEKRYENTTWTLGIDECLNGDLVVTCMTVTGQFALMRCDASGNVLWSKIISDLGDYPISVIALNNGNIFVNSTFNITGKDFSAMLLDPAGNIIWSKAYGGIGYIEADYQSWGSKAVYDSTDNTIVLISETAINGNDDIIFAKLKITDGSIIWSKIIGDANSEQGRDIVQTSHGFAIVGNSDSYPVSAASNPTILSEDMSERDILLCNFDTIGNLLWARTYGGVERDKGIGLRYNSDNTFLISAYTSSPVFGNFDLSMDPLFIKTDSIGIVGCQYNSPAVTVQNISLVADTAGTISNGTIFVIPANSIISPFVPTDTFQCLQCATVPVFKASDTIVCVNDPLYFYNTTTVGLVCFQRWLVDGQIFDGSIDTIFYSWSIPGTYTILLYSDCGVATDTFKINIQVNPKPVTGFIVPDNCLSATTNFFNTSNISSGSISNWSWNFGDNSFSQIQNPGHIYAAPGNYVVHLSAISDYGCPDSTSDSVQVFPLPVASFAVADVCLTDSVRAINNSVEPYPVVNYNWSFDDGFSSSLQNVSHLFPAPGNHSIQLAVTDIHGCSDNYSTALNINPMPVAKFEFPPKCDVFPVARFKNESSNGSQWLWNFGDSYTSTDFSPSHSFDYLGLYNVSLMATSDKGCIDSVSGILEVNNYYNFWIPNSFTPNGDINNESFKPVTEGVVDYTMDIYNRWGSLIFSSNDVSIGWDAIVNGRPAQMDVYVYKISATDVCGEEHFYIGRISLLH